MDRKQDRRGLGRGLSALMADVNDAATEAGRRPGAMADRQIPIEQIHPNPQQPRRHFDAAALKELADSIRTRGVIQPLIVRRRGEGEEYEIVAGERRWRAAQMAELHVLPVLVREFTDSEVLEIAIIENVQRADLSAIEEAEAYRQLMQRFGHTQEKIAEALSRSRSHIANLLRLLTLPDEVQDMVRRGVVTAGHARALVGVENATDLAAKIVASGLSVRATEDLVRNTTQRVSQGSRRRTGGGKDADTRALEADLSANLQMVVQIEHDPAGIGGRLIVKYRDLEGLDLLCRALSLIPRDLTDLP